MFFIESEIDFIFGPNCLALKIFHTAEKILVVCLNDWHPVLVEIEDDEVIGRQSIMPGSGTEARFRHLRVREALPNADLTSSKAKLTAGTKP